MAFKTYMDPAALPNRSQSKPVFDRSMADFYRQLPEFGREINETVALLDAKISQVDTYAAGGTYSFPYIFDSATADADPGVSKLRLSSTTQTASTVLRLDMVMIGGAIVTGALNVLQAGTSSIKGSVRIVKVGAPGSWLLFDIVAVNSGTGYHNLSVAYRAGSAPSPFANGDSVMIYLDRNGDAGTVPGMTELIASLEVAQVSPVAAFGFPSVFSAAYDWYFVHFSLEMLSGDSVAANVAIAGAYDTSASYGASPAGTSASGLSAQISLAAPSILVGGVLQFGDVNSSRFKSFFWDGAVIVTANSATSAAANRGLFRKTSALSGFQIRSGSGNPTLYGSVRVYGMKKQ